MANTTATAVGQQQLYNDFVLKGFLGAIAPLRAFAFDVSPAPAQKGYAVNVTYVPSGSTATAWTEAGGYTMQASLRQAVTVNLSNHYFVSAYLTDEEIANSSLTRIEDQATMNGANLGLYVVSNIIAAITGSSFAQGVNVTTASAWTVDDLVTVRKKASQLYWPLQGRNVIVTPGVYHALLKDDDMKYIYRGQSDAVTQGSLRNIYGWSNIYEAPSFPTTMRTGSVTGVESMVVGLAVNPNALAIAMRYLKPGDGTTPMAMDAYPLTDQETGVTLGYRKWYDPNYGQTRVVYDVVWGKAAANTNAAINLTSGLVDV